MFMYKTVKIIIIAYPKREGINLDLHMLVSKLDLSISYPLFQKVFFIILYYIIIFAYVCVGI